MNDNKNRVPASSFIDETSKKRFDYVKLIPLLAGAIGGALLVRKLVNSPIGLEDLVTIVNTVIMDFEAGLNMPEQPEIKVVSPESPPDPFKVVTDKMDALRDDIATLKELRGQK